MNKFIPLSVPNLKGNEKKYLMEAIDSEWVSTAGPFVKRFEKEIADYLDVNDAAACQSGTAGLHLALTALGINHEHAVIVPALTFIAAVNPVRYVGAEPIFMDCDDSLCMDPQKLLQYINEHTDFIGETLIDRESKKVIKAMIVVHVFGNMCDMEMLIEIARQYNLLIIEDATEALGTKYSSGNFKGRYAGTMGDIGVYSFNGNKIITAGGGGMTVAQDGILLNKMRYLSAQAKDDEVNFIHNEIGFNYRMTNIQAALGVAQLEQLDEFIETKARNYGLYRNYFEAIKEVKLLKYKEGIHPNYWFYSLLLTENCKLTRDDMISGLAEHHIQARPIWGLINEQKPYLQNRSYRIEKAKCFQKRTVNIPCSSNLTEGEIGYICKTIARVIK